MFSLAPRIRPNHVAPHSKGLPYGQEKYSIERARRDTFHRLASSIMSRPIGPCVALDCEMVGIGAEGLDSALARVSLVDWEGRVILDTFVHVPVPVTDYRTYVSGVTAKDLESGRAIYLEDCRYLVQTILHGRVLIGHALVNDLSALMLTHPWHDIRDTSTYVPFMQVCKPDSENHRREMRARKLSDLARERLGTCIQQIGRAHSSVEDARAALELYKVVRNEWETLISWKVKKAARPTGRVYAYSPPYSPVSGPQAGHMNEVYPAHHIMKYEERYGVEQAVSFPGYPARYEQREASSTGVGYGVTSPVMGERQRRDPRSSERDQRSRAYCTVHVASM